MSREYPQIREHHVGRAPDVAGLAGETFSHNSHTILGR
jgi:hypothetical protein